MKQGYCNIVYACGECKELFRTRKIVKEPGYFDEFFCPFCFSEEVEKADICDECGEYFFPGDLSTVGKKSLCERCAENVNQE